MNDLPAPCEDDGEQLELPALDDLIPDPAASSVWETHLGGLEGSTVEAYRGDMRRFSRWLQETFSLPLVLPKRSDPERRQKETQVIVRVIGLLAEAPRAKARGLVLRYKAWLMERYAPATTSRALAAIRSILRTARQQGVIDWTLDVADVPRKAYKDTRGPAIEGVDKLFAAAERDPTGRRFRNLAMLSLLCDRGLRREEVVSLDLEHLDLSGGRISIRGKGRKEREWITVPQTALDALTEWLFVRGTAPGPLFVRLDSASAQTKLQRLTGRGLYKIVRTLGEDAGIRVWPHALRHHAITRVVELNGGNLAAAMSFSRHKDPKTLTVYLDNLQDLGGAEAESLGEDRRRRQRDAAEEQPRKDDGA